MILLRRSLLIIAILCASLYAGAQQTAPAAQEPAARSAASQQASADGHAPATKAEGDLQPAGQQASPSSELSEASNEAAHEEEFRLFGKWVIPGPVVEVLRWANFAILFGILGWLLRKPISQFFRTRTAQILQSIQAGLRAREESARRLKGIEEQFHGLSGEIAEFRRHAEGEARAERERLIESARAEAARILAQTEQDVDAVTKAALSELKQYAADLAVGLAEKRIRERLTPARQAVLVRHYAAQVGAGVRG